MSLQVDIDLADPDEVFSMRPSGTTKAVMTAMPEDGPGQWSVVTQWSDCNCDRK